MKNEFLQSKEGNAFVKLVLWLIFIGVLFFAFAFQKKDNVSEPKDNEEETKTFKNIENMKNDILQNSYNEVKNDTERDIKYNLGTIEVNIKTNLENITNILVIKDNIRYEMQFTNIGICDNISLEN